jgi:hypothetical protein
MDGEQNELFDRWQEPLQIREQICTIWTELKSEEDA